MCLQPVLIAANSSDTLLAAGDHDPPQYLVILHGNFSSDTGEDFTQQCVNDYNTNLRDKATSKIPELNQMLGTSACTYFAPDDASIVSVNTFFTASGSQVRCGLDLHPGNSIYSNTCVHIDQVQKNRK